MSKTIREIYREEFVNNPETSLLKRYNSILNKTPDELNVDDICVLIRQEFFLDIAVPKAIKIISENPSAGDNYDYCLLYNLAHMESSLGKYKDEISKLIMGLEQKFKDIIFELDSDRVDFSDSIQLLKEKIK